MQKIHLFIQQIRKKRNNLFHINERLIHCDGAFFCSTLRLTDNFLHDVSAIIFSEIAEDYLHNLLLQLAQYLYFHNSVFHFVAVFSIKPELTESVGKHGQFEAVEYSSY
jgi:hypothetical protein